MDRKIDFRGIPVDSKTGEYVYGSLVTTDDASWIFPQMKINLRDSYIGAIQVDPKTVGQYIGLEDKNGKEIYEGDRRKTEGFSGEYIDTVYWSKKRQGWSSRNEFNGADLGGVNYPKRSEIIGSVHDKEIKE